MSGCLACDTCYQNGKPCSVDEAFNSIADDILSADVLVFAMPVYWYTIPAQIKAVIDHLYCFCLREKEEYFGKQCALLACCEEHDLSVLDGVRIPFERTAALSKWEVIGEVLVPGVLHVGDITATDGRPERLPWRTPCEYTAKLRLPCLSACALQSARKFCMIPKYNTANGGAA